MYYYVYMNVGMMFFCLFLMFMFLSFYSIFIKLSVYIELELNSLNSMKNTLILYFDFKTFLFMGVVMLISSMILFYSIEYMSSDLYKLRFLILLSLFVVSMMLMILGQNLLMILLGWDGLGLISYCLVIYYNSWSSFNAGMLTVLSNRLGDIGMLISIGLISMMGSWNYMFFSLEYSLLLLMMMMCFITKSAQIPFSSWLPAAMAAPTPISSLVHSSTLVTAGIYLLMRFFNYLLLNKLFMNVLMLLGLMTMFMAGLIANMENDFKKIIALSTLSQLGLMMLTLCLSLKLLSFFHLIIHALFKSMLFMCAGLILHSMIDNQDIRFMGSMNMNFYLTMMYFNCANLALCGYPFMSGFFSKDLILEMSLMGNNFYFVMILFYISIGLTVMYTFRLLFYMNLLNVKFFLMLNVMDNFIMNFSMLILFLNSIMGGIIFSKMVFSSIMLSFISVMMKLLVNMMLLIGMILGIMMNYLMKFIWKLKGFIYLIYFNKSMFGLSYLFEYFFYFLKFSVNLFSYMEKGWVSFYSVNLFMNVLNYAEIFVGYMNVTNLIILMFFMILLM